MEQSNKTTMRYNKNFINCGYIYESGVLYIDLSDINDMKCIIDSDWSYEYACKHVLKFLQQCTGVGGGWNIPIVSTSFKDGVKASMELSIESRLYRNLRRIYGK